MKVVAAIAAKGGAGKTTLLFALGNEAAKTNSAFFMDLDPQGSLAELCAIRDQRGEVSGDNPLFIEGAHNVETALKTIRDAGLTRDYVFVDTPGSMMPIIRHAVAAADCIIIPIRPSMLDIRAQQDAAAVVAEYGKTSKAIFVLNAVDKRVGVDDAVEQIEKRFGTTPLQVSQRVAYARAHIIGKSGPEIDGKCLQEIAALWDRVQQTTKGE